MSCKQDMQKGYASMTCRQVVQARHEYRLCRLDMQARHGGMACIGRTCRQGMGKACIQDMEAGHTRRIMQAGLVGGKCRQDMAGRSY